MKPNYNKEGLIPVITQDATTLEVLMLAYMNEEAYTLTLETKKATYFSRSRKSLWVKGETSGNTQEVVSLELDCAARTRAADLQSGFVSIRRNRRSGVITV